jgi:hypothetical protein
MVRFVGNCQLNPQVVYFLAKNCYSYNFKKRSIQKEKISLEGGGV